MICSKKYFMPVKNCCKFMLRVNLIKVIKVNFLNSSKTITYCSKVRKHLPKSDTVIGSHEYRVHNT